MDNQRMGAEAETAAGTEPATAVPEEPAPIAATAPTDRTPAGAVPALVALTVAALVVVFVLAATLEDGPNAGVLVAGVVIVLVASVAIGYTRHVERRRREEMHTERTAAERRLQETAHYWRTRYDAMLTAYTHLKQSTLARVAARKRKVRVRHGAPEKERRRSQQSRYRR